MKSSFNPSTEMKYISVNSELNQRIKYKPVSLVEAKKNPYYVEITERIICETLVIIMQRNWRKKHNKEYKGKYSETLNGPLLEPVNIKKYLELVNYIQKGKWKLLDFKYLGFTRAAYRALRVGDINTNQLVTTLLLYEACHLMSEKEGEINFTVHALPKDTTKYDPRWISYMTDDKLAQFHELIKNIPPTDSVYFHFEFPQYHEALFILLRFRNEFNYTNDYPGVAIRKHIENCAVITDNEKNALYKILKEPHSFEGEKALAIFFEKRVFELSGLAISVKVRQDKYECTHENLNSLSPRIKKIFQEIKLLQAVYMVFEEMPFLRYCNKRGVLSLILPSIPILLALQKAVHGNDMTYPYFTLGKMSPTDILNYLMKPQQEFRAVELIHPDVRHNEKPHGYEGVTFSLTWHDLFHVWRCGALPKIYKNLFRYNISVLQKATHKTMDPLIWQLTDMDFNMGRELREAELEGKLAVDRCKIKWLRIVLSRISPSGSFWTSDLDKHQTNLCIVASMVLDRETWRGFLGDYPENIFNQVDDNYKYFHAVVNRMKMLVNVLSSRNIISLVDAYKKYDFHDNNTLLVKNKSNTMKNVLKYGLFAATVVAAGATVFKILSHSSRR